VDYLRGQHASSTLTQGTALKIIARLALAISIGLYGAALPRNGVVKFDYKKIRFIKIAKPLTVSCEYGFFGAHGIGGSVS
jgi:hypothetical protein